VPDNITIPMILNRLKQPDCAKGWLLDGFPRNLNQARQLDEALTQAKLELDYVIEIVLDRQIAKNRIMGRRLCVKDNNHPNNVFIEAIQPASKEGKLVCRICGSDLISRADDQDESAIDKRHAIYFDSQDGTLAAVNYFKEKGKKAGARIKVIELDGRPGVQTVSQGLLKKLELIK